MKKGQLQAPEIEDSAISEFDGICTINEDYQDIIGGEKVPYIHMLKIIKDPEHLETRRKIKKRKSDIIKRDYRILRDYKNL